MNALVIGGSGGLSSFVASKALKDYSVYGLTRGNRPLPEGVKQVLADRNDKTEFKDAIEALDIHFDVVFDCIAMNEAHALEDLEILPEFTNRLIVVSTDSVYDGKHKAIPENENGILVKDTSGYAGDKRMMEEVFAREMKAGSKNLSITIFRPGHIYGPGFKLGCFPEHSRQEELPDIIKRGEAVRLVGMGTYIIHPIYVEDLADTMIDCVKNEKTFNEVFCIGGPEAVENRTYYEFVAKALGVDLNIKEIPLEGYLEAHPEYSGHLCHRVYDLTKLKNTGIKMPQTHLFDGIRRTLSQ